MVQVLDINTEKPIKGEKYFVDTNVWYWFTYVGSKEMNVPDKPEDYQVRDYPQFIERALSDGASLCHSGLTFSELSHIIETTELNIYRKKINDEFFERKAFRKIKAERDSVLNEIDIAWKTICGISECIDSKFDPGFVENVKDTMSSSVLDSYDAFYVELMRKHRVDYIVTDDRDFCTMSDGIVMTANRRALK